MTMEETALYYLEDQMNEVVDSKVYNAHSLFFISRLLNQD